MGRSKAKKVLFVCGYSFLFESYALRLRQDSFEVFLLENANDNFIEKVVEIMPDLIYLYLVLPGFDGFKALGSLKADKRTKDIPVIFENRKTKIEDIKMGIKLGAIDYLIDQYTNTEIVVKTAIDYFKDPNNYLARYPIFVEILKAGHSNKEISKVVEKKIQEREKEL